MHECMSECSGRPAGVVGAGYSRRKKETLMLTYGSI